MKVNESNASGPNGPARTQRSSATAQISGARGGGARDNDAIQLSGLSHALATLQLNTPQRNMRLGELSAEVGIGAYLIDPHAVSGSLIRESLAASGL